MIIEKITIKSFGKLKDLTMEFSDGINVIEGENEAGKSTIAAFIKYMFYGFPDGARNGSPKPDERKKRLNWDTGIAAGSMQIRSKGKRYLITRSTTPSENGVSYKEENAVLDLETGAPVFGKAPAGEIFFGADRTLFENTAFIGRLGETDIDEDAVKESIENILFSANEHLNIRRALTKLQEKADALLHENNTGGLIYDLTQKKERLEQELAETDANNRSVLGREAELHKLRIERDAAVKDLENLNDQNISYGNVMIIQSFDSLHDLERECEEKTERYERYIEENTVGGFVPDENYRAEVTEARRTANECHRRLDQCEEDYLREKNAVGITREIESAIELADSEGGEKKLTVKAKALHAGVIRSILLAVLCLLAGIAAAVFEVVGKESAQILLTLGWVLLALAGAGVIFSAVLLILALRQLRATCATYGTGNYTDLLNKLAVIGEAREKRDHIIASTDSALVALEQAKADYRSAVERQKETILRWAPDTDFERGTAALDEFEAKLDAFLGERARLNDERVNSEITVTDVRRRLSAYNEIDVRAKVSPLKRKVLSGVNHDEITNRIAATKETIATLERELNQKEDELALLKLSERDPGELYSRIQVLERQIAEQTEKLLSYRAAYAAIEHAEAKLREEISPRLGEYATSLMEIMTNRRYGGVKVDDGLIVSFTDEEGRERSVDFLSGGTRDMAYIAVRMALIDMLYPDTPPVCFDESFAHQDNVRARCMMQAIAWLADTKEQQSFLFTCRSRESTLAREILSGSAIFKLTAKKNS